MKFYSLKNDLLPLAWFPSCTLDLQFWTYYSFENNRIKIIFIFVADTSPNSTSTLQFSEYCIFGNNRNSIPFSLPVWNLSFSTSTGIGFSHVLSNLQFWTYFISVTDTSLLPIRGLYHRFLKNSRIYFNFPNKANFTSSISINPICVTLQFP